MDRRASMFRGGLLPARHAFLGARPTLRGPRLGFVPPPPPQCPPGQYPKLEVVGTTPQWRCESTASAIAPPDRFGTPQASAAQQAPPTPGEGCCVRQNPDGSQVIVCSDPPWVSPPGNYPGYPPCGGGAAAPAPAGAAPTPAPGTGPTPSSGAAPAPGVCTPGGVRVRDIVGGEAGTSCPKGPDCYDIIDTNNGQVLVRDVAGSAYPGPACAKWGYTYGYQAPSSTASPAPTPAPPPAPATPAPSAQPISAAPQPIRVPVLAPWGAGGAFQAPAPPAPVPPEPEPAPYVCPVVPARQEEPSVWAAVGAGVLGVGGVIAATLLS